MLQTIKYYVSGLFLILVLGSTAQAITIQNLLDGQEVRVADKIFTNWEEFTYEGGADYDSILVESLADDPMNPGLRFTTIDPLALYDDDGPIGFTDFVLTYDVLVDNPMYMIHDYSIEITQATTTDGEIRIETDLGRLEDRWHGGFAWTDVEYPEGESSSHIEFEPVSELNTGLNISVRSGSEDDETFLEGFEVRYSQVAVNPVPEPTTVALLGIGLVGLAGAEIRRRRKKKVIGKN